MFAFVAVVVKKLSSPKVSFLGRENVKLSRSADELSILQSNWVINDVANKHEALSILF